MVTLLYILLKYLRLLFLTKLIKIAHVQSDVRQVSLHRRLASQLAPNQPMLGPSNPKFGQNMLSTPCPLLEQSFISYNE